ncbi:hypothetical protein FSP39_004366 [Pinctada imbricata]|uniref:LITAF domain-containing protein n=1 Tax=Pinctada imbricata TaxID=66713 RepID=A0AA88YSV8_PINIB|nr:hypothetical protein FSP39_004366 [Pinctada imbricata]
MSIAPPSYEECVKGYALSYTPGGTTGEGPPQGAQENILSSQYQHQPPLPVGGAMGLDSYSYPVHLDEKSGANPEISIEIPDGPPSSYPGTTPEYQVQISGYAGTATMKEEIMPGYAPDQRSNEIINMHDEPTNVILTTQPEVTAATFKESPVRIQCPHCNKEILTETEDVIGSASWFWCFFLMFFGCFLGCCLIPFFTKSCLDVEHTCPECGETVGTYSLSTPQFTGSSRGRSGSRGFSSRFRSRLRHRNRHHQSHLQNMRQRQRKRRQKRQRQRRRRRRRR